MADREKVIGHLNDCMEASRRDNTWVFIRKDIIEDALALLKEQEAVKPVTESSVYDPDTWFFVCGSCKKGVIDCGDKFCRWCGQAVK